MKTLLVALAFIFIALPATANAQDWVMNWHSTGNVTITPFMWDITGASPATLTPLAGGLPPSFSSQAYNLSFTYQGHTYGGEVAQGNFQAPGFSVPAPLTNNTFSADFAAGDFNLTGNTFTLHAFIGPGHNTAEFTATGTRSPTTASAAEPSILLFGAVGLVGAVVVRRSRKSRAFAAV